MDGFTVRAARPEDAPALQALVDRAYSPYLPLLQRRPAPMDDDYERRIEDGQAFLAVTAGAIAGVVVLVEEPGVLLIDNVAVDPAFQGTGLGRLLMCWSEEEAGRRGVQVLRLYTNERMVRNVALYERLGYRETHRMEQAGHRRVFMAKRLAPAGPRHR